MSLFLWGKLVSLNYSPVRTYYMTRNHIVLKKMYSGFCLSDFFREMLFRRLVRIVLIEKNKIGKIRALFVGIIMLILISWENMKFDVI